MSTPEPRLPEPRRLASLRRLHLLDSPEEDRFDRITRLARRIFAVPVALFTLVDRRRQWFKSALGLDLPETPRRDSFSARVIQGEGTLIVTDTLRDPRFAHNPLVRDNPRFRFYAGHPVRAPGGAKIGTLCLFDYRPRRFTAADCQALRDLAALLEDQLRSVSLTSRHVDLLNEHESLRRRARVDSLTRVWNRPAILEILRHELARARRSRRPVGVLMADLDLFKSVNDRFGHLAGDVVLRETVRRMRASLRAYDALGRYGGEEFLIVLPGAWLRLAIEMAERVRRSVASSPIGTDGARVDVTVSVGAASAVDARAAEIVAAADQALYRAKSDGRDRVAPAG